MSIIKPKDVVSMSIFLLNFNGDGNARLSLTHEKKCVTAVIIQYLAYKPVKSWLSTILYTIHRQLNL